MKNFYVFALLLCLAGQQAFSQSLMDGVVQNYFNILNGESHFKQGDLTQWKVTDVVPSLNPDIQHVYVQQLHNNIPIQFATYKLTVKNGNVVWQIDQFVADVTNKLGTTSASLSPENAVLKTVRAHNLKTPVLNGTKNAQGAYIYEDTSAALEPIVVKQLFQLYNGQLRLVWNVSYYQKDGQHWWNENIDANTGQVLRSQDWVITCNWGDNHSEHNHNDVASVIEETPVVEGPANLLAGESYNVYAMPLGSPLDGGRSIVNDPQNLTASPFGWHDTNGSNGAEHTITRGNNVWAQDDTNGNNGTGSSPDGGAGLDFDFPINLNNQPGTYLDAATTNLFYWNNIMHDVWYQYGFNEASGNFQENNYGNGGAGSDSVNADCQDGSGLNNANFSTPTDGGNPRMQMFLWSGSPQIDGDLDNIIIAHEYGHGISIRLVGGPGTNGLGGSEQMGEGWSDWFGLMLTMKNGDAGTDSRAVGNYALGQGTNGGGIRPTPYSTNTSVNGTTYGDIPGLAVPHGVGYAWATIIWDMTWALVGQEGFDTDFYNGTGGNNIAMALVIEGLKNTANNPGFVSGRDGILQADQDLYGGQYNCIIWDVFAARGVGIDANENTNGGTNSNNDQTTSFTSGCGGGTPDACSGTVASFPDAESFETNFGNWTQSTANDDINWTRDSAGTPSTGTGPSDAADGTTYIYVEASGNGTGYPNKRAILYSPCYDLSGETSATFNYSYHMFGATDMGSIDLEVSTDDGVSWSSIWNRTGNQGNQWNAESIDLNAYAGEANLRLRFNRLTGSTWQADIALDAFEMEGGSAPDTQAPSNPTNLAASGINDTSLTLNWNASTDNVGVTGYEVFQGGTSIATTAATTYNVTGLTAATAYSFQVRAFDAAGNNSGLSNTANATTTGGGGGGCSGGVSTGYSESFESSIGDWTQASGDDLDWTRDSGGTPSANTGPSSGSAGSWYMYVEASGNGTGYPNKRAILNSPCIDLSGETAANFNFDYHMYGAADMGSIALEASTDGSTWTSLFSQTGNQGNQWNAQSVSLNAYAGGEVQLRFNRFVGSTWQADIAIDNVSVTAGGGNPPTGYCASNGNNTSDEYIQRVQIGGIDNVTGASAGGYGDYTSLSTTLSSSNSITITPLWTGTIYNEAYAVFVDWNRDGDFGDAGELAYSRAASTATPVTGSFNVPSGASAGSTRMRVSMKYNGIPTACESFSWGEVEDYIVVIPSSLQGFGPNDSNSISGNGNSKMSLYPNPVKGNTLNVEVLDAKATEYIIYNMIGQVVTKAVFTNSIDVSLLQSGVYMIQINAGDEKFVERFIKE